MTPTPSSVARAREIVKPYRRHVSTDAGVDDRMARKFNAMLDAIADQFALALDAQRERDAKIVEAYTDGEETWWLPNYRGDIAKAIREGKE